MKMMNSGNFLLILTVLLFGLVLVSFLGSSSKEGYTGSTIADPNGAPIPTNYEDSNGNIGLLSNNGYSYIMMITNLATNSNPIAYTSTTNTYTTGAFGKGSQSITFAGPNGILTGQFVVVSGTISFEVTLPAASSSGTPMVSIFIPSYASSTSAPPTTAPPITTAPPTTAPPTTAPTTSPTTSPSANPGRFSGQNGSKATISDINNNPIIVVTNNAGQTTTYTLPNNNSNSINTIQDMVNIMFYGPNGGSARVFQDAKGNLAIEATQPNGNTNIFTADDTYSFIFDPFGMGTSSGTNTKTAYNSDSDSDSESNSNNSNGYKKKANRYQRKYGNQGEGYNKYYNNSLPAGIPRHMIPGGQQDLYILKSEIVPPVCPVCPSSSACPRTEKAPPCPACARCPEPSFECKKVPNYKSNAFDSGYNSGSDSEFGSFSNNNNSSILPEPVISSFSSFGM
jgi:hypothetical protein